MIKKYFFPAVLIIIGVNESSFLSKRPSTSEVNSVNPKKPKPSESVSGANSSAAFPSAKSLSVTSSQAMSSKGKYEMWHIKKKCIDTV